MPRTKQKVVETNGDDVDEKTRISLTIDQKTRKYMRIAAAVSDMDVGEWCIRVLAGAAKKQVAESMGTDEDE